TGSDIAGSIRIPSSFCGVVGFKPPYGRVPEIEIFNLDHYSHEGPLARTVADCALLENVIAGPHPSDVASIREIHDKHADELTSYARSLVAEADQVSKDEFAAGLALEGRI